jgi:nitroreductase
MLRQLDKVEKSGVRIPPAVWNYYRKEIPLLYTQGVFNVLGLLKRLLFFTMGLAKPVMRGPTSRSEMRLWAVKSTSLACENLMLAVSAQGYDTCPLEGFDGRRLRRFLALSRDAEIAMVIAIGKRRADKPPLPQIREARSEHVFVV